MIDHLEVYIRKKENPIPPLVIRPVADQACSDMRAKTSKIMLEADRGFLEVVDGLAREKGLEVRVFDLSTFTGRLRAGLNGVLMTPAVVVGHGRIEGDISSEILRSRLESLVTGRKTDT